MKKYLLAIIIILFLATRLYNLNSIPNSLYWDEAAIGVNADSLSRSAKDEWGEFLPIHFRSFGEFKLPIYIYTVALFQKLLGSTETAVRLPAVLFSLITIVFTYLIAQRIFKNQIISLFSAFLTTITPWFFIFSRTGYEATAGLSLFLIAIYFFLNLDKNINFLVGVVFFIASAYAYNSYRIIVPLVFPIALLYWWFNYKKTGFIKLFLIGVVLIVIGFLPIIKFTLSQEGLSRLNSVGIFSDHLGAVPLAYQFLGNYLLHFSPGFLWITGDTNIRSQIPNQGQLFIFQFPLLILGLFLLLRQRKVTFVLPVLILLVSIIPAAITKESPHGLRALSAVPFLSIIASVAIVESRKIFNFRFFYPMIVFLFLISFSHYFYLFASSYQSQSAGAWQGGYKLVFNKYYKDFDSYDRIVISDEYAQPYIFYLWYLHQDPQTLRPTMNVNSPDKWGYSTISSIGKVEFRKPSEIDYQDRKILIIADPKTKSDLDEDEIVKLPDGNVAFYIYRR